MHICLVAPFAGAWIEIPITGTKREVNVWSLPSRERGLKYLIYFHTTSLRLVAPFAGAWIEITRSRCASSGSSVVAPFAGAWIEIIISSSLWCADFVVAPFAGAWIEIQ